MTLADMKAGAQGQILRLDMENAQKRRLLDMGLTPGVSVRLIGSALLGDPLILMVRGSRVSVRKSLAKEIQVKS